GLQEIGKSRARTANEAPGEAEQQKPGDGKTGKEMHQRRPAAPRADQEKIATDQDNQRPVKQARRQIPNRDLTSFAPAGQKHRLPRIRIVQLVSDSGRGKESRKDAARRKGGTRGARGAEPGGTAT